MTDPIDPIYARLETDAERWNQARPGPPSLDEAVRRIGPRRGDRKLWLLAAASVLIVVGAALIPVLVHFGRDGNPAVQPVTGPSGSISRSIKPQPSGPLACPPKVGQSPPAVPAKPAGVDGQSHLVPATVPTRAVICAFDYGSGTTAVLAGSKVLTGDLAGLAAELTWIPPKLPGQDRACTLIGNTQVTGFLVGLNYPTGTVWISTATDANGCVETTNGVFASYVFLGARVPEWYAAGRWTASASPSNPGAGCPSNASGRWGQQSAVVPAAPNSVQICTLASDGGRVAVKSVTAGIGELTDALNAAKTTVSGWGCQGDGSETQLWELLFGYPDGPPVLVRVSTHCDPGVDNGSLQTKASDSLIKLIETLAK